MRRFLVHYLKYQWIHQRNFKSDVVLCDLNPGYVQNKQGYDRYWCYKLIVLMQPVLTLGRLC